MKDACLCHDTRAQEQTRPKRASEQARGAPFPPLREVTAVLALSLRSDQVCQQQRPQGEADEACQHNLPRIRTGSTRAGSVIATGRAHERTTTAGHACFETNPTDVNQKSTRKPVACDPVTTLSVVLSTAHFSAPEIALQYHIPVRASCNTSVAAEREI